MNTTQPVATNGSMKTMTGKKVQWLMLAVRE